MILVQEPFHSHFCEEITKRKLYQTSQIESNTSTVKALLSPRGAYLILDTPEERLIREGGLFKKLDDEDIYDGFISLLPRTLRI